MLTITATGPVMTTREYELVNAPDVFKEYVAVAIRPNHAKVTLVDGEATRVDLRGPRVLSDGRLSTKSASDVTFGTYNGWPEFVQEIARAAERDEA